MFSFLPRWPNTHMCVVGEGQTFICKEWLLFQIFSGIREENHGQRRRFPGRLCRMNCRHHDPSICIGAGQRLGITQGLSGSSGAALLQPAPPLPPTRYPSQREAATPSPHGLSWTRLPPFSSDGVAFAPQAISCSDRAVKNHATG